MLPPRHTAMTRRCTSATAPEDSQYAERFVSLFPPWQKYPMKKVIQTMTPARKLSPQTCLSSSMGPWKWMSPVCGPSPLFPALLMRRLLKLFNCLYTSGSEGQDPSRIRSQIIATVYAAINHQHPIGPYKKSIFLCEAFLSGKHHLLTYHVLWFPVKTRAVVPPSRTVNTAQLGRHIGVIILRYLCNQTNHPIE